MISKYLRYRRQLLALAAAACLIFSSVTLLGGAEGSIVLYADGLFIFIFALYSIFDFFAFKRKYRQLSDILENASEYSHAYPGDVDALETLYIEIIAAVCSIMRSERDRLTFARGDQLEYYTMWLHQIKTPIAAMHLALERTPQQDPVFRQELFKIERYVEMALQFAKLETLSEDIVLTDTDVDSVVVASIKKYADIFIYKGLSVDFSRTSLRAHSDEKWLAFIVEQLLSNSSKYTSRGGVKIYVDNGDLIIKDSGTGIKSEDLPRVFEKGYTGYNGRMDKRASGLGLYMSAMAAKKIGVRLSLSSEYGAGTTARIVFPLKIDVMEPRLTKL